MVEIQSKLSQSSYEHTNRESVLLIDPPTFPKGVLSLGLSAVAASLPTEIDVRILDLNIDSSNELFIPENTLFVGLKVSSQNFSIAKEISEKINQHNPNTKLIWGGELPTLLPKEAIQHCDSIVIGSFEPITEQLVADLRSNQLKESYDGQGKYRLSEISPPNVISHYDVKQYHSFMGIPMETSRGCDKKCTFCLVHVMQSSSDLKPIPILSEELKQYDSHFINVVDYNIAVHREHLISMAQTIEKSRVLGWMAELCLESLDDDEVLIALQKSRCKMIYCGLESLDEQSLKSVNKSKTNVLENYERIIRKAQKHNIQIAAGLILGLEGMNLSSFTKTLDQFTEWGIIYTKMTFLTYNPGTKVKKSMQKKGRYLTEKIEAYDGNHLSFLANDVAVEDVYQGSTQFIQQFYSFKNIVKRSINSGLDENRRIEFVLFNLLYRSVYLDWLKYEVFKEDQSFDQLLRQPFKKSRRTKRMEFLLKRVREELYTLDNK